MNMVIYSRAQRSDYDSWDMPGWSADDLLPYMKKVLPLPSRQSRNANHSSSKHTTIEVVPRDLHGHDGPISVSSGPYRVPRVEDDFLAAFKATGDWDEIVDLSELQSCNGAQRAMRYVSPDGKRSDAAHAYLHPRLGDGAHPNLHVVVESEVARIILDNNKRASGIVYRSNSVSAIARDRAIKARKGVIVTCGTFGTPLVLERSGIGHANILKRAGVDLLVEIPGVGDGYQDHHLVGYPYHSSLEVEETMDAFNTGRIDDGDLEGNRVLGWNGVDITCKIRPSQRDVASLGSDFEKVWERDFKSNPDKPLAMMAAFNG